MRTSTFVIQLSAILCGAASLAFAQTPAIISNRSLSPASSSPPLRPSPLDSIRLLPALAEALVVPPRSIMGHNRPAAQPFHRRCSPPIAAWPRRSSPPSDSDIKMELWLPVENWNGKFEMVGNGGWAGIISFPQMARRAARWIRHRFHRHRS